MNIDEGKSRNEIRHWTDRWNWISCTKLALSVSWAHDLIAESIRPSERNSVVVGSNPFWPTFYSYFKESFSGECHMYQVIPLHSCDYLKKLLIKTNMATDEGKSWNGIGHWKNRWNWSSCTKLAYSSNCKILKIFYKIQQYLSKNFQYH